MTTRHQITEKAAMRRRNKNTTPDSLAAEDTRPLASGLGGGGSSSSDSLVRSELSGTTEAAESHPVIAPAASVAADFAGSSVADLRAARDRIVQEVEGDAGFALFVTEGEPDLWERLSEAIATGAFTVPSVIDLPARRRIAGIEGALDAFDEARIGGPCGACGAVVPPRTRWTAGGYLTAEEPTFHPSKRDGLTALCSFCHDYLGSGHTLEDLRERVGNSIGGVAASPGPGYRYRFAHRSLVPFAHEVGVYGKPWGHITDVQRRAVELQTEKTVHPRRLLRTAGEADRVSLPGLPARVHPAPHRGEYVAPVVLRPEGLTPAEEAAAMDAFHEVERAEYLEMNPRPFDGTWDGVAGWSALMGQQDRERKAPALWRERAGDALAAPPATTRPAYVPPTGKRRETTPEALLSARQTAEREAYLAAHKPPAQTSEKGPWKGRDGWLALLARHEAEARDLTSSQDGELRTLEQRQAAARDDYLRRNPKPRNGAAWTGSDGWATLLESQGGERKRFASAGRATASAGPAARATQAVPV